MRLTPLGVLLALAGLTVTGWAQTIPAEDWGISRPEQTPTSSWYGSTGLILIPTAQIAPVGKLTGGFHRVGLDSGDQDVYNANVALIADLEFGVARVSHVPERGVLSDSFSDQTIFNAKYRVNLGSLFGLNLAPDMVVGVFDAADKMDRSIYLVASKALNLGSGSENSSFNLHVGYGKSEHGTGALDGIFFGVDLVPATNAVLQLEYDADAFNGGVRYFPTEWLSVDAGYIDGDFGWGASVRTVF